MRRHRVALITSATLVAFVAIALPIAVNTTAHQEATVWKSPLSIPVHPSDRQVMTVLHGQFVAYTTTVLNQEKAALVALAAAQAAKEAKERAEAGSTSRTSTTTASPAPSEASPSGVDQLLADAPAYVIAAFHCIAYGHESGGDPTAENSSSGDSGLYQFNDGTWAANGGAQFGPKAMDAPVWAQDTVAYWTWQHDGFQPWTGDNSCWE
jgi:Transglycosylase-like domain